MKLSLLLKALTPGEIVRPAAVDKSQRGPVYSNDDPEIHSLHYRDHDVGPAGLFVAIPGLKADGHDYINSALDRGAAAVLVQKTVVAKVPTVRVKNSRKALAALAARFYGYPAAKLTLIGITGTNGKTTTSYLIEQMLQTAGLSTGVIGTVNYRYGGKEFPNPVTTPESVDLQQILADMQTHGVTHVVVEVSSHAIDLHRIDHCYLDVGVFTNLTQDHLDYHGDLETYWSCKRKLFTRHLTGGPKKETATAVINGDDIHGRALLGDLSGRKIATGAYPGADVTATAVTLGLDGIRGTIHTPAAEFKVHAPLIGAYNLENILSAVGAGQALGLAPEVLKAGIDGMVKVPGRLERIDDPAGRHIFVDYAHTPDALEQVLMTLKAIGTGRLLCVFGCGGDRDRGKRPLMGAVASRIADVCLITSDNPRNENPRRILDDIVGGLVASARMPLKQKQLKTATGYLLEPDRQRAIEMALGVADSGDVVLIAGKGHETYQIIGSERFDFDDRRVAAHVLRQKRIVAGLNLIP